MLYTVFDIETTGLNVTQDDIIQFSYIRLNSNLMPVSGGNLYLYHDHMRWSEEACAVHQISKEFLYQHKDSFEENLLRIYSILERSRLVGYNCDRFDTPFAASFLQRHGLPGISTIRSFDVMKVYGKQKLSKLIAQLGITDKVIKLYASGIFGELPENFGAHDARYDVAATALAFSRAVRQGLVQRDGGS